MVIGSNIINGFRCLLEQELSPLLLSTGWFQERTRFVIYISITICLTTELKLNNINSHVGGYICFIHRYVHKLEWSVYIVFFS